MEGEPGWDVKPYDPSGAVQGKVMDTSMAEAMSFIARIGHPCGTDFDAAKFLNAHADFSWQAPILEDMDSGPWTQFRIGEHAAPVSDCARSSTPTPKLPSRLLVFAFVSASCLRLRLSPFAFHLEACHVFCERRWGLALCLFALTAAFAFLFAVIPRSAATEAIYLLSPRNIPLTSTSAVPSLTLSRLLCE